MIWRQQAQKNLEIAGEPKWNEIIFLTYAFFMGHFMNDFFKENI